MKLSQLILVIFSIFYGVYSAIPNNKPYVILSTNNPRVLQTIPNERSLYGQIRWTTNGWMYGEEKSSNKWDPRTIIIFEISDDDYYSTYNKLEQRVGNLFHLLDSLGVNAQIFGRVAGNKNKQTVKDFDAFVTETTIGNPEKNTVYPVGSLAELTFTAEGKPLKKIEDTQLFSDVVAKLKEVFHLK